ncbi:REP-associated tyrosine transposase [Amphritea sp.]|uniref:REP-associated tyrosine transposase n=1 Tax=Amphritea sp. TaxID=1872502 RepID=UPI003D11991E
MARPLRIEFAGALYHVTARGNARAPIYFSDEDRDAFLTLLAEVCNRFNWACHAYCLMDNHYHLLIETADANLSKGMRQLNGVFTQYINRTHSRVGHLFQGRYKAILVEKDSYLQELSRYIVLNPVRARMVYNAEEWPWSSYRAMVGLSEPRSCLTLEAVLSVFGLKQEKAQQMYRLFVDDGLNQPSPWEELKNQVYLGSDAFVDEVQCQLKPDQSLEEIPRLQKSGPLKALSYYAKKFPDRNEAMIKAYQSQHYTLKEIGEHFGISYSTVSRAVNRDAKYKT